MLQNISVRFDPVEDRLVLKLILKAAGQHSQEHWLHLTRRTCAHWRQDLQAMVDLSAQAPERLDPAAKRDISSGHHQAMASQAKMRSESVLDGAPPAHAPLLVMKITCGRRRSDQRWVITFERRHLPALGLILSDQTMHALGRAVTRHIQAAAWALPPIPMESAPTGPAKEGGPWH